MLAILALLITLPGLAMATRAEASNATFGHIWTAIATTSGNSASATRCDQPKPWAQQWMLRAIMQRAILVEITDALALPRPRKVPLRSAFTSWRSYGRECKRLAVFWRDVAIPVLSGIDK